MIKATVSRIAQLVATAMLVATGVVGQTAGARPPLFAPLLADPKEPRFFATYLWDRSARLASRLGSVGFGQTIGLLRTHDWQVAVSAGVFSQFNMQSVSTDLMNTDYIVGFPVSYRHGAFASRFRLYHQSSHLGDEYMVHTHAQRVSWTYEAAEWLVSEDVANFRAYGGAEYVFTHSPADLKPGVLHAGFEYRAPVPALRLGHLAAGRWVAAVNAKSVEYRAWSVGWNVVTGLELGDPQSAPGSSWRWSVLLTGYEGPSPYGQFYTDHVTSAGLGIAFTL